MRRINACSLFPMIIRSRFVSSLVSLCLVPLEIKPCLQLKMVCCRSYVKDQKGVNQDVSHASVLYISMYPRSNLRWLDLSLREFFRGHLLLKQDVKFCKCLVFCFG